MRFRGVGPDGVAVNIQTDEVLVLNGTGLLILELIKNGAQDMSDLTTGLAKRFDVDAIKAAKDIRVYLEGLEQHGIVLKS